MLQYEEFESHVLAVTGKLFYKWRHLLPVVPLAHRHRFMATLKKGFDLPQSFDFVMTSQTINDSEYHTFLAQATMIKVVDTSEPCPFADALLIAS